MSVDFQITLDIPNIRITSSSLNKEGQIQLEVSTTQHTAKCSCCQQEISEFAGFARPLLLQHKPIMGKNVILKIRPKRYRCRHCEGNPTSIQQSSWFKPNSTRTDIFKAWQLNANQTSTTNTALKKTLHDFVIKINNEPPVLNHIQEKYSNLDYNYYVTHSYTDNQAFLQIKLQAKDSLRNQQLVKPLKLNPISNYYKYNIKTKKVHCLIKMANLPYQLLTGLVRNITGLFKNSEPVRLANI